VSKNKPGKPLKVLIIDDDPSFVAGLKRDANTFRIELVEATNLEDGLLKLQERSEKYFSGVILDVICLKDRKQQIPDPSFISKAMEEFNRLAPSLPKVILSGEPTIAESVKRLYDGNTKTYHKSAEQIEEMLAYFVKQSENLPRTRIVQKYSDVFWLFDNGYLDHNTEQRLIDVLEKMIDSQSNVISSNLGELRKIQEAMYQALNSLKADTVPVQNFKEWKDPQFSDFMKNLISNGYVEKDKIIDRASWLMHKLSSEYGAHLPKSSPDFSPTKYTVQMCAFAMLDLLLWFKGTVEAANSK
jgi:ActR/RegA family two-component response regulator